MPGPWFWKGDLHNALEQHGRKAADRIRALDADRVLATPVPDLVAELLDEFRVDPITLGVDSMTTSGATDVSIPIPSRRGRPLDAPGTRIEFQLPFSGDAKLFELKPSTFGMNPPRFEIRNNFVVISHEGRAPLDPGAARREIDQTIAEIQKNLGHQLPDIEAFNSNLDSSLEQQITVRRDKVLKDRELEAFFEIPIVGRDNSSSTFAVNPPSRPRAVPVVKKSGSAAFKPEPAITPEGFAEILTEIESVTTAVQRLPKTFVKMPEESLRDVLLVVLNNRFGPASGESFSRNGKTDIFIPWDGDQGVVFIAECKVWKGPKGFRDAIDQLLGYLTWRDTRAALIVFVKSGEPSAIVEKAKTELRNHDLFKRDDDSTFTLANQDDSDREIHVALLVIPVLA